MKDKVCIVAIAKDELKFIDEWVVYHRLLGIDHIFLYDDEDGTPLFQYFEQSSFVTVVKWHYCRDQNTNLRNQILAYWHAIRNNVKDFEWVAFIDIDEFLVIRDIDNIKVFLKRFPFAGSISLNWHVFGHSGFFDDPDGLITANLTRRMYQPSVNVKTIVRTSLIVEIMPDYCTLRNGKRVDANNRAFSVDLYPGRTEQAHINHYQCRSFTRWMKRAERGDVNFNYENAPEEQQWRLSVESCLRKFVTTVAFDKNEFEDTYMKKFEERLLYELNNRQKLKKS